MNFYRLLGNCPWEGFPWEAALIIAQAVNTTQAEGILNLKRRWYIIINKASW